MSYLPRPEIVRVAQDVDEIYLLAAGELQRSMTAEERRTAFKQALLRCYAAGVDAQREITRDYKHDHNTHRDLGILPRPRSLAPRPRTVSYRLRKPPKDD